MIITAPPCHFLKSPLLYGLIPQILAAWSRWLGILFIRTSRGPVPPVSPLQGQVWTQEYQSFFPTTAWLPGDFLHSSRGGRYSLEEKTETKITQTIIYSEIIVKARVTILTSWSKTPCLLSCPQQMAGTLNSLPGIKHPTPLKSPQEAAGIAQHSAVNREHVSLLILLFIPLHNCLKLLKNTELFKNALKVCAPRHGFPFSRRALLCVALSCSHTVQHFSNTVPGNATFTWPVSLCPFGHLF